MKFLLDIDIKKIDRILSENELRRFTPQTCADKADYRAEIMRVREEGIAFDREEYIEGIVALAVPLKTQKKGLQAAIWAAGLRRQASEEMMPKFSGLLKGIAEEINLRFSLG